MHSISVLMDRAGYPIAAAALVFSVALVLLASTGYGINVNLPKSGLLVFQGASSAQSRYNYNTTDNFNTESIGADTPYRYFHGYKVFDLGIAPSQNYRSIVSPCNQPANSSEAFTAGIYNCQPSFTGIIQSHGSGASTSSAASIESLNWAGYVGSSSSPVSNSVLGSWIVQTASKSSSATYSSQWTGIGGFSDDTLIQAGTESDYYNGAAHYDAWYELLPGYEIVISNFPVSPGDVIYANITAVSGEANEWQITMIDETKGEGFSITVSYASSQLSSEWVEERPEVCSSTCSLSSLSNFGTAYYGNDYTQISANSLTNYANMGSGVVPVASLPGLTSVTMVNEGRRGSLTLLATPSSLSTDGTSFYVYSGSSTSTSTTSTSTTSVSTTASTTTVRPRHSSGFGR